ncbi:MAG TPA: IPT/TIG domain-containing protein [Phycisphaerae bacterium]|nr:IPT/TIG domain-containing protein [Phycisphaerae bacterium]HRY67107.1 IPT/TIG domain-containing protein [Phycisphaerae bacterium]HSA26524.1 IPT/TIG domain-containing protein [Phycisphaerae bacterium]
MCQRCSFSHRGLLTLILLASWAAWLGTGCAPPQELPNGQSGDPVRPVAGPPVVLQITPDLGRIEGGTPVTVTGQQFDSQAGLLFGDLAGLAVEVVDATTIKAVTPPQLAGKVAVTVRNGTGEIGSLDDAFEYAPSVSPVVGPIGGGTEVTILGTGFPDTGLLVLFDLSPAVDVQVVNSTTVTAVTPPHAAGAVSITLKGVGGEDIVFADAFQYVGVITAEDGPRLVSAVATSNTTVLVTFSEAVGEGAGDAARYSITQTNVNPESGRLIVQQAVPGVDGTTVLLTTAPQNEVTYELHVTGIKDLAGNPLAAPELLVDPTRTEFAGKPFAGDTDDGTGIPDTDGDGLADNVEQSGWMVAVELVSRTTVARTVTSDLSRKDTDNDGLSDAEELAIGSDPRNADTDGDMLGDAAEWNEWFSSPTDQDSDNDTLSDSIEVFFKTSPVLADTDGDQLSDEVELIERNRNPLIADLPRPQITVDEVRLALKIRSQYTDEKGQAQAVTDATSASFSQSRSETKGRSDTTSTMAENTVGAKLGAEIGGSAEKGVFGKVYGESSYNNKESRGFTSTVSSEQVRSSQEQYQQSVARALIGSQRRAVTRSIDQAEIVANVNISNDSDIAFTVTNLEISVQQQDRRNSRQFRPIATLWPSSAIAGDSPKYNLGPFDPERGPIIFRNVEVFPNLVDDLMREPAGLVFQVVNYDILDEFGRNFVFASQETNDRTAGITIDFGDGTVEAYRIATASKFDSQGRALGITMERGLEIAGLTRVVGNDAPVVVIDDPVPAEIRDTYGTWIDGDGVERLTRIRGVQNDLRAVSAKEKRFWAILSSNTNLSPDASFSTIPLHAGDDFVLMFTRDVDRDNLFEREEYLYGCSDHSQDTDGDGLDDFFEVRTGWLVYRLPGLPYKAFPSPALADSDGDELPDDQERKFATDPNRADTDDDALSDLDESSGQIEIVLFDGDADDTNDRMLIVTPYSSWAITDGGNGLADTTATGDDLQVIAAGDPVAPGDVVIEPGPNGVMDTTPAGDDVAGVTEAIANGPNSTCDTLAAGDDLQIIDPGDLALPGQVVVRAGPNGVIDSTPNPNGDDYIRVKHERLFSTNPLSQDTDNDGLGDGREVLVGTNPNARDAGKVIDSDGDGLFDDEEDAGWDVTVYAADGTSTKMENVKSNRNRPDTDLDGLPDVYERAIGSNPQRSDTDGDGLIDSAEFDPEDTDLYYSAAALRDAASRCVNADHCAAPEVKPLAERLRSHVCMVDTDGDTLSDYFELKLGWVVTVAGQPSRDVYSKPYASDSDGDGLNDAQEQTGMLTFGPTDPLLVDTDEDSTNDNIEVSPTRSSNPCAKDKYLRFTIDSVICERADDAYNAAGNYWLDMHYELYIKKAIEVEVTLFGIVEMSEGGRWAINKTYDYIIGEDESVSLYTKNVYDEDDGNDDYFPDFNVQFRYEMIYPMLDQVQRQENDDGKLATHYKVEEIHGVP